MLLQVTNPRWSAPEVIRSSAVSLAADVFSFGVVMWELLTWQQPYEEMMSVQVSLPVTAASVQCWFAHLASRAAASRAASVQQCCLQRVCYWLGSLVITYGALHLQAVVDAVCRASPPAGGCT